MYNFCVAIDDALMGITHVLRAEEHLPNTLRQVRAGWCVCVRVCVWGGGQSQRWNSCNLAVVAAHKQVGLLLVCIAAELTPQSGVECVQEHARQSQSVDAVLLRRRGV